MKLRTEVAELKGRVVGMGGLSLLGDHFAHRFGEGGEYRRALVVEVAAEPLFPAAPILLYGGCGVFLEDETNVPLGT
jgi:hypothetical protein